MAISNYLEPGQAALTTSHFWTPYRTIAEAANRKLETFAMFDEYGRFNSAALDTALAQQTHDQGRALLIINDPCHNPSGYSMSAQEWQRVAQIVQQRSERAPVTLLVDTAYAAYGRTPVSETLLTIAPLLASAGLLFAWSASKTFTHYGARVGALVACVDDPRERQQTFAAFSHSCRGIWSNCNRGGLWAVTRLLSGPALAQACARERQTLARLLFARADAFNAAAAGKLAYPATKEAFS